LYVASGFSRTCIERLASFQTLDCSLQRLELPIVVTSCCDPGLPVPRTGR